MLSIACAAAACGYAVRQTSAADHHAAPLATALVDGGVAVPSHAQLLPTVGHRDPFLLPSAQVSDMILFIRSNDPIMQCVNGLLASCLAFIARLLSHMQA